MSYGLTTYMSGILRKVRRSDNSCYVILRLYIFADERELINIFPVYAIVLHDRKIVEPLDLKKCQCITLHNNILLRYRDGKIQCLNLSHLLDLTYLSRDYYDSCVVFLIFK